MFSSEPVSRLSTQRTRWPSRTRRSQRCDPRKPAPPVTTEVGIPRDGTPGLGTRLRSLRTFFIPRPPSEHRELAAMGRRDLLALPFALAALAVVAAAHAATVVGHRDRHGRDDAVGRLAERPLVQPDAERRRPDGLVPDAAAGGRRTRPRDRWRLEPDARARRSSATPRRARRSRRTPRRSRASRRAATPARPAPCPRTTSRTRTSPCRSPRRRRRSSTPPRQRGSAGSTSMSTSTSTFRRTRSPPSTRAH